MEERDHELWESVNIKETQPLTGDAIIQVNLQRKREGYKNGLPYAWIAAVVACV